MKIRVAKIKKIKWKKKEKKKKNTACQNCGDNKKISGCQGGGGGTDEQAEYREFLVQWKYSIC